MTEENIPHDTMSMPDKIHIQLVNSPHGDMIRRFSTDEYFEGATTYYKKVSNSTHLDIDKLKKPEIIEENGWYSEYNAGWNECLAYMAKRMKMTEGNIQKEFVNDQLSVSDQNIPIPKVDNEGILITLLSSPAEGKDIKEALLNLIHKEQDAIADTVTKHNSLLRAIRENKVNNRLT